MYDSKPRNRETLTKTNPLSTSSTQLNFLVDESLLNSGIRAGIVETVMHDIY